MLDMRYFYPEVYQAVAGDDYTVYAYMNDGSMRLYNAKPLIEKGGIFKPLKDKQTFRERLTVINGTIAWDLQGTRDASQCIDVDPLDIYSSSPLVDDVFQKI
jgi:hypothetical protein